LLESLSLKKNNPMENSNKRKAITLETEYQVISKRSKGVKPRDLMQSMDLLHQRFKQSLSRRKIYF